MFKIYFYFLDKTYSGTVQKINHQPVQFIVFGITLWIGNLPEKLVFLSNPERDQLIYQSFDVRGSDVIRIIGETIFQSCNQQRISVHA